MTLLMVPGNVDEGYVQHMDIIYRTIDKKGPIFQVMEVNCTPFRNSSAVALRLDRQRMPRWGVRAFWAITGQIVVDPGCHKPSPTTFHRWMGIETVNIT